MTKGTTWSWQKNKSGKSRALFAPRILCYNFQVMEEFATRGPGPRAQVFFLHFAAAGFIWIALAEASALRFLGSVGGWMWEGQWSGGILIMRIFRQVFRISNQDWIPSSLFMLMLPNLADRARFLGTFFCLGALLAAVFGLAGWFSGLLLCGLRRERWNGPAWCLAFQSAVVAVLLLNHATTTWQLKLNTASEFALFFGLEAAVFGATTLLIYYFAGMVPGKKWQPSFLRRAAIALSAMVWAGACLSYPVLRMPSPQDQAAQLKPAPPSQGPSGKVLLLTIDTLRIDHTSMGHYALDTTPALAEMARESVSFDRYYTSSSWTLPSMMSLITGISPLAHGVEDQPDGLAPGIPTLAEILRGHGYHTSAFYTHIYVSSLYGFQRGYDDYDEFGIVKQFEEGKQPVATQVMDKVEAWLDGNTERPFFLAVHLFDPHWNYTPPRPYDQLYDPDYAGSVNGTYFQMMPYLDKNKPMPAADLKHLKALYDGEIKYTNDQIERLFNKLKELHVYDDMLIIVTSDHGEEFKDHGSLSHIRTLYQEVLHVPLLIKFPRSFPAPYLPGTISLRPATTLDIAPTIMAALGLPPAPEFSGLSLIRGDLSESDWNARPIFGKTLRYGSFKISLIRDGFKFIYNYHFGRGKEELYDLSRDPKEKQNLATRDKAKADAMRREVFAWVQTERAIQRRLAPGGRGEVKLDAETIKRLKSIGYLN